MKYKKNIQLDDYELDLENNFEKAAPLTAAEKESHINALKQATGNYMKKSNRRSTG